MSACTLLTENTTGLQAIDAADTRLFQILQQPRRDDRARSLLYDPSIPLAPGPVSAAPFRPGGFQDVLAQTCLQMVTTLAQVMLDETVMQRLAMRNHVDPPVQEEDVCQVYTLSIQQSAASAFT